MAASARNKQWRREVLPGTKMAARGSAWSRFRSEHARSWCGVSVTSSRRAVAGKRPRGEWRGRAGRPRGPRDPTGRPRYRPRLRLQPQPRPRPGGVAKLRRSERKRRRRWWLRSHGGGPNRGGCGRTRARRGGSGGCQGSGGGFQGSRGVSKPVMGSGGQVCLGVLGLGAQVLWGTILGSGAVLGVG